MLRQVVNLILLFSIYLQIEQLEPLCYYPNKFPSNPYTYDIKCKMAKGSFIKQQKNQTEEYVNFMEYNIDEGKNYQQIIDKIKNMKEKPSVILISEASRGCSNVQNGVFVAEEIAKQLEMAYVYAPEFLEYADQSKICTTGNAILSKYELQDINFIKFDSQCCWFRNRLGGRNAVQATINIQNNFFRINSLHLESGTSIWNQIQTYFIKINSAQQIISNLIEWKNKNSGQIIVGGDFNSPFLQFDPVIKQFLNKGYFDTHQDVRPWWSRKTSDDQNFCLDYFLVQPNKFQMIELNKQNFAGLSDHYPIMINYRIEQRNLFYKSQHNQSTSFLNLIRNKNLFFFVSFNKFIQKLINKFYPYLNPKFIPISMDFFMF